MDQVPHTLPVISPHSAFRKYSLVRSSQTKIQLMVWCPQLSATYEQGYSITIYEIQYQSNLSVILGFKKR